MSAPRDDDSDTTIGEAVGSMQNRQDSSTENDVETGRRKEMVIDIAASWDNDPNNPLNWPASKKALQVTMLSSGALLA